MNIDINIPIDSISIRDLHRYIPLEKWQNLHEISKQRATIVAQTHNHTIELLRLNSLRFITDPEYFIKAQLLASAYYGFDAPCVDYDFYNIEAEALGQKMVYRTGLLPEVDVREPLIADKKDLGKLTPEVSREKPRFDFVLGMIKLYSSVFGKNPKLRFCGPTASPFPYGATGT